MAPAADGHTFTATKYQDVTTAGLVAAWRSIGVQSVAQKQDLPEELENSDLEQVPLMALENLHLEEGGQYWPIYVTTQLSEQA